MDRDRIGSAGYTSFDEISDLQPQDQARFLDAMVSEAILHTGRRRRQYRLGSVVLRLSTLVLGGSATVILGLTDLPPAAKVAFSMTAIVTVLNALEPFFNFRDIWVVQEEALWRFRSVLEELRFRVVAAKGQPLDEQTCRVLFEEYKDIWARSSKSWLSHRKSLRNTTAEP